MAFIFDSEEQFEDAYQSELDRYGELRERLFNGGTLSYGEMEELLAQAKTKGDEPVVRALGNVVDDPPTDGVGPIEPVDAPVDDMMAEALNAGKKARFDDMMEEACCSENELGEIEEEEDLDEEDLDEASWSQDDDDFLQDLFTGYSGVPARERDAGAGNGTEVTHRDRVLAGMKADRGPKSRFKSPSQAKGLGDFDAIGKPDGADAAETADFGGSEPVEESLTGIGIASLMDELANAVDGKCRIPRGGDSIIVTPGGDCWGDDRRNIAKMQSIIDGRPEFAGFKVEAIGGQDYIVSKGGSMAYNMPQRVDVEEELHKASCGPLDESFVRASLATLSRIDI